MKSSKRIVTNIKVMRSKYGTKGWKKIEAALDGMIAADAKRGFETRLIAMDRKADMQAVGVAPITDPTSPEQNKKAVDAIFAADRPEYLVILGGPDVVPHQPLVNPLHIASGDPDEEIPSDLPYGCEAPFGVNAESFTGPTRVVGRLPGITGEGNADDLVGLIETASGWKKRQRRSYENYFAISADSWQGSTKKSVRSLFGNLKKLVLSPPDGPEWPKQALSARSHFINLHGDLDDPSFYGEDADENMPVAHSAGLLASRIREGTVVAAECCYGAELYDPNLFAGEPGMANVYLAEGAYGYLGSTTISYGPADSNGQADLICRYFLNAVLQGASLGRALLQARQEYVAKAAPLNPFDLKTLAQFILLGDPSVHATQVAKVSSAGGGGAAAPQAKGPGARSLRRNRLLRKGIRLGATVSRVRSKADGRVPGKARSELMDFYGKTRFTPLKKMLSFRIHGAPKPAKASFTAGGKAKAAKAGSSKKESAGHFVVSFARRQKASPKAKSFAPKAKSVKKSRGRRKEFRDLVAVVAHEKDGKVEDMQKLYPR